MADEDDQAAAAVTDVTSTVAPQNIGPPAPLPPGWVLKESRSNPEYYYYFHQETGECSWTPPFALNTAPLADDETDGATTLRAPPHDNPIVDDGGEGAAAGDAVSHTTEPPTKRQRRSSSENDDGTPSKVRILHILKKHKDSRRPSSWRIPKITISKSEATEELQSLLEVLQEVQDDPTELRATMEELARTESDCSSAKRGGDLGLFGRNKMHPEFEKASFALPLNQLSEIVSTDSGVHVLLRVE